jgi:hypothetical protein
MIFLQINFRFIKHVKTSMIFSLYDDLWIDGVNILKSISSLPALNCPVGPETLQPEGSLAFPQRSHHRRREFVHVACREGIDIIENPACDAGLLAQIM